MSQQQPATIARTYRAAIKHGEDYTTVEETVVLPIDASDEEIQQAVATGLRIFAAQHLAVETQIAQIRANTPAPAPPEPASDGQRTLIDALAEELGWSDATLDTFAAERQITVADWQTLTKRQAHGLIDALKRCKTAAEPQRAEVAQATDQPTRQAPDPDQLTRARTAQAEAHAHVGLRAPSREQRPMIIRDPEAPASDPQMSLIRRKVDAHQDRTLEQLAPQIAAVFNLQHISLKQLRAAATWLRLRDQADATKRLTMGRASQLISLLDTARDKAAA